MSSYRIPALIVGGGLGGVSAALALARLGERSIIAEQGGWLGGQLTGQAVPPDENRWIDELPPSVSYAELRERIRAHYRAEYPLTAEAAAAEKLNPGLGRVSRLCHEPRVSALAIETMVSPWEAAGLITVLRGVTAIGAEREGDRVRRVHFQDLAGDAVVVEADVVIDATELGEVLPLAEIDHVIGAEARSETGEDHAPDTADPLDQQAISWCAALEFRAGEDHTIARPADYEHWRDTVDPRWPGSQLSWADLDPITRAPRVRPLFAGETGGGGDAVQGDLWHYRRVLAAKNFDDRFPSADITLVNWPQVDYWEQPLLGVDNATAQKAREGARQLTLSFIHWMQTEAPRADGGVGYPELKPRGDVVGSRDGLARDPYIRESRRIRALQTVTEGDIGRTMRGDGAGSALFDDSVGVGFYRIDLHPSTSGRSYVDIDCYPFQIPLGALIPESASNVLAANKNIGTTHITNGAYRLHPVEWSIGEAAGVTAASMIAHRSSAADVRLHRLDEIQRTLTTAGVRLAWPDEVRRAGDPRERDRMMAAR